MAESLAKPFVSFAVERLGGLLNEEANFLRGVKVKVEQLKAELIRMQCFLKDADAKREDGDERVRNWVAEIRELAYDAEDVIQTFIIKVASARGVFIRYSISPVKDFVALHKVGMEIESIKTKISSISTSLQTYGVRSTPEGEISRYERQRLLRQTYPHIMEEGIAGLDDDLKTVVDHLVNEDYRGCRVVSIWGMGGIGKTTLAKKVYHHNDVKRYFDCRVWVYISQQCNPREVLEQILIELGTSTSRVEIKAMTHAELVKKIYQVQSEKKCLVILDDIWETQTWDLLVPAFQINKSNEFGSKILITTRKRDVASYPDDGQHCFVHELRLLNEVQSWELFEKKARLSRFVTGTELSAKMAEQGKEMVKHCGGLPLAIVVLGGLLATKYTLNEWEIVSSDLSYYLNKDRDKGVMNILALSYQDLPYHLKACFLYLSHLPEDRDIRAKKLVQMWMAEDIVLEPRVRGEVLQREEETMLDVGFRYLGELAQRSMVQVQLTKSGRRISTCGLHDLMLEFCVSKAHEENFFKIFQLGTPSSSSSSATSSSSSTTIRRIAFHYFDGSDVDSWETQIVNISNHHHIRSCLFYFEKKLTSSDWKKVKSLFRNFKLLRVLDHERIRCVDEMMLPREIGYPKHLRYLSVEGSDIIGLPSSIGNLLYLQTLNLRTAAWRWNEETIIPNVLWRLEQLRHLYLPERIKGRNKLRLDGLSKLETLKGFNPKYCDVSCFATLTNLRKVQVVWAKSEDLAVILNHSYPHLRYSFFRIRGDFQMGEGQRLLRQLLGCRHLHKLGILGPLNQVTLAGQFATNLTSLALQGSNLEEDPMSALEKLPNLVKLEMWRGSYIGKEMVCSAPTPIIPSNSSEYWSDKCRFPRLKYLRLSEIYNLEDWRIEDGAMLNLLELVILSCPKLKQIPDGLKSITTLQKLEIGGESMLRDRLQEGGEDFNKVQHVPSIIFSGSTFCCFIVDDL